MGTNKLALALAFLFVGFFGCGLDTAGTGEFTDESQMDADTVEPEDVPDADTAEDAEPDDAGEDEAAEDVVDGEIDVPEDAPDAEDTEPEDFVEDEAGDETDADGEETDDGGIVDPCERPDIPATGIQMFFCFADDITSDMTLYLQVESRGTPVFPWAPIPGCMATDARSAFCELPLYYNAVYIFNIEIPGIGIGWSCGPATDVLWGTPRVWVNHAEQTVSAQPNVEGGCNHLFTTPPSGPL